PAAFLNVLCPLMPEAVQVGNRQRIIDLPFPARAPVEVGRAAIGQLQVFAVNPNHLIQNSPVDASIGMPRLAPADIQEQLIDVSNVAHRTEAYPHVDIATGAKIGIEQADLVERSLADH